MIGFRRRLAVVKAALGLWSSGWRRRESGAVSPIFALMLVPLIGGLGMGAEVSNWYLTQRAMQNAADVAAIAAATNGTITQCTTAGDFCYEAKAAAGKLGYVDGVNNVTVAPAYLTSNCPGSVTDCYEVTITKNLPLELVQVAGFTGTSGVTVNGARAQRLQVVSIARAPGPPVNDCMVALGASGKNNGTPSFKIAGGPQTNLQGCSILSNGSADCTNGGQNITSAQTIGTSKNCGTAISITTPANPYSTLSNSIPTNKCSSYITGTPKKPAIAQTINASTVWSSTTPVRSCGNAQLTANVDITAANSVLVVYNGYLDLNGHTLSTSGAGSLTIIFSGTTTGNNAWMQYPTDTAGGGVIDITAPTSGSFGGVAIMQDINLSDSTGALDLTYSGNNPILDVQGLIYFPNGNFSINGAINFHQGVNANGTVTGTTNGLNCIGVVANNITVNGTGAIFDNSASGVTSQCAAADLVLPGTPGARLALVQ